MRAGRQISISYADLREHGSVSHYTGECVQRQVAPMDREEERSCKETGLDN
jgi:hypothetical protein